MQQEQQPPRRLFRIEQFAARHSFLTSAALRAYRFDARHEDRHGFRAAGAFLAIGRKVLIDEERFFAALTAANGDQQRAKTGKSKRKN